MYQLNDNVISELDLGVNVDSTLNWERHVNDHRSKANKMLGLVKRTSLEIADTKVRRSLYLSLVRSQLSYTSQVWCLQTIESVNSFENRRRRVTKVTLNFSYTSIIPYPTRLAKLDL